MVKTPLTIVLSSFLAFNSLTASCQDRSVSGDPPTFEVAAIKSPAPGSDRRAGFYGEPGGHVFVGGTIRMLAMLAFNLQYDQISGDLDRMDLQWFEINAVPPETSPSRNIRVPNVEPTPEQRLMLQSLLRHRFGFQSHFESKDGDVYILARGHKTLQLRPPKDRAADPRANIVIEQSGIANGEAMGVNTTLDYLAQRLGKYLHLPVLNETGIAGSYDFELSADDPDNADVVSAIRGVVERLGLELKRGRGPIRTLVIDHVQKPSEN